MDGNSPIHREPMLEMFIFETNQLIEQLEEIVLDSEKSGAMTDESVNEIFRIMHTIKGSSAMMMFDGISLTAHALEDLFFHIRENKPQNMDYSAVFDLALAVLDHIREGVGLIEKGEAPDPDVHGLVGDIKALLSDMGGAGVKKAAKKEEKEPKKEKKHPGEAKYRVEVNFDDGCGMENIRAFTLVHNLKGSCSSLMHMPEDLINDCTSAAYIAEYGFILLLTTDAGEGSIKKIFDGALFLRSCSMTRVEEFTADMLAPRAEVRAGTDGAVPQAAALPEEGRKSRTGQDAAGRNAGPNIINVNVSKLDKLLDLVGEIVITESMVTGNPEVEAYGIESFIKASRQLRKLTDELQDIVMSIRMIPVSATFNKMQRLVRDLNKKLGKEAELVVSGESTEVDKNIIDLLADPLMHLIRNAMDHGIEDEETRRHSGKPAMGRITLSAVNTGGEVLISLQDDGRGLDRDRILKKARAQGLVQKPENELTEKEIFSFILLPGFSTSDRVTELSGRGVGMDVVRKNIEKAGGSVSIDSVPGMGTAMTIRIPLTLAIIDGMEIGVGNSVYTLPIASTVESFRPERENIVTDPDGNEMIMIRGSCYPVVRLHRIFNEKTGVTELDEGIITVVENDKYSVCLFADRLIGEQQVVVKALPAYITGRDRKLNGIGGCTILGDGSISLIIDINSLLDFCSRMILR